MTRSLTAALYLLLFTTTAGAQANHLKCFKVKDSLPKATYTADLGGLVPQNTCTIRVPAVMACVPTDKTNVMPTPPGGGGTGTPNSFFCYKVKCPKATLPPITGTDQFGSHTATPKPTSLVCAPIGCPPGDVVCGTACVNEATDPNNCGLCGHVCPTGGTCVAGVCSCPAGDVVCGTACVDEATDPNNCGGCGHVCPISTPSCVSGACT